MQQQVDRARRFHEPHIHPSHARHTHTHHTTRTTHTHATRTHHTCCIHLMLYTILDEDMIDETHDSSLACLYMSLKSLESYVLHGQICTRMYPCPTASLTCYTIYMHMSCTRAHAWKSSIYACQARCIIMWGGYDL